MTGYIVKTAQDIAGAIGVTGPRGNGDWFQEGIKVITNSKWPHSFVVEDEKNVIEAAETVRRAPLSWYRDNPNCIYELYRINDATPESIKAALNYARGEIGKTYGYFQILWFLEEWYGNLEGKITPENPAMNYGDICSELAGQTACIESPGFTSILKASGRTVNTIAPEHIYKFIKANSQLFTFIEGRS